jgi:multiple sugar transport system substrate-binding protein
MKRKSKWFTRLMPIFLGLVLVVSACGEANEGGGGDEDGDKVNLKMTAWGNPAEIKVYQKALDAFEEENPNVTVDLIPAPGDTYKQKLFTQLQGGEAPDVFYVGSEYMSQLVETETIAELTQFLDSSDSYVKADEFAEGLWGSARLDGKIYGLPVDSNPLVFYYNKNVLEEAGIDPNEPQKLYEAGEWNWDSFLELTTKLKDADKYGFVAENWWAHTFSWVWTNGGQMYDEDGNIVLAENEQAKETFNFLSENVKNGNFTYAGSLPKGQGADAMFLSNQVGFIAAGRWHTPLFSQTEGLKFDYIPWPSNTGNQLEKAGVATAYIAATKDSKHLEEAMKFISFYTSEEGQTVRLSGNGNAIPSVTTADDIVAEAEVPEHVEYLIDARNVGITEKVQSSIPGLDAEVNTILDLMYLGEKTPEETIKEIVELAKKTIKEYKEQ